MATITETTPLSLAPAADEAKRGPKGKPQAKAAEDEETLLVMLATAEQRINELEARLARMETVAANTAAQVGCLEVGMARRDRLAVGLNGLRFLGGASTGAFNSFVGEILEHVRGGGGRGDGGAGT